MIIYLATNTVNGMQYVGLTRRSAIERRIFEHKSSSRRGVGRENTLAHAMRLHGEDAFSFRIIQRVESLEALAAAERYWIKKLNTSWPSGYNVKPGGCHSDPLTTGKKYTVDGVVYYGCGQLGDAFGIDPRTIRARLERHGWTLRQAVGLDNPPQNRNGNPKVFKPVTFRGKRYESRTALCRAYNVTPSTFEARTLKYGWTIEQALGLAAREKPYTKPLKKVVVFGQTYRCLTDAAKAFNQNFKTVHTRLSNGWSMEEALQGSRGSVCP